MKCSICGTDKPGEKLSGGWKKKGEQIFCHTDWRKLYHIRAVTFPVAGPAFNARENWPKLRTAIATCWQSATMLANWTVTEMAKADIVRMPDMEKLPKPPLSKKGNAFYLYPHARKVCPGLDTNSVVSILNTVQANYKKRRFDVIWRGEASLQRFRYPYPYPVPAAAWSARWLSETERVPIVSVPLAGERWDIRLRGGKGFQRQLKSFAQLISGDAVPCEMALYRVRAAGNDNRIGIKDHANGATAHYNIMCKLVMWLPKPIVSREPKTLIISTNPNSFIIASFGDFELWRVNGDHVKRWIAEYDHRRHRLSEDLKAELRIGGKDRFADLRERLAKHQNDRLKSFIHTSARSVSDYANRHKCSDVYFNDECRTYLPDFPWHNFKTQLSTKLDEHNIAFEEFSDRPKQEDPNTKDTTDSGETAEAEKAPMDKRTKTGISAPH